MQVLPCVLSSETQIPANLLLLCSQPEQNARNNPLSKQLLPNVECQETEKNFSKTNHKNLSKVTT